MLGTPDWSRYLKLGKSTLPDNAFTRSCGSFCKQPRRVLLRARRFIDTNPAFRYLYFRPGLTSVKTLWPLWLLLLCGQFSSAQTAFTKPSEAYEYARRPLTEWETAIRERRQPATPTIRPDIAQQRGKALCPSFSLNSTSGEELYWLAKLCENDHPKALAAVQRYLAGTDLAHAPDARMLLALLQMRATGNWEAAWGTIRTILQEDPIDPDERAQIDVVIDDEATTHPETALEWSKQRYEILLDRMRTERLGMPPVLLDYVLSAGSGFVHQCYVVGETEQGAKVLDQMNGLVNSHPTDANGWGGEDLHWANLEMHAAPPVTVLKMLGGNSSSGLIQAGRVEVISFFFLGCSPCMYELPHWDALQGRYGTQKLLVTDITTYKVNSYLTPSTHSNIEASLEKARLEKAPRIGVLITSDETLASYGISLFPSVAIVDKMGRLRYIGRDMNFEDDDSLGVLLRKLVEE
jgi:thiol-disulfide isomerase/thioredoxin